MSALREEYVIDRIEVLPETGEIRVRRVLRVLRGDEVIAKRYHRDGTLMPGDPLPADADPMVRRHCETHWTPEVVAAHRARVAAAASSERAR